MNPPRQQEGSTPRIDDKTLMVRFPLPCEGQPSHQKLLWRLGAWLPRRWRRWVVIQGQHFWLPN